MNVLSRKQKSYWLEEDYNRTGDLALRREGDCRVDGDSPPEDDLNLVCVYLCEILGVCPKMI